MKRTFFIAGALILLITSTALAQITVPRASQKSSVNQAVGDAEITIVYHRPNVKGRTIWGELVPIGEVWRTGANNATVFEVTQDAKINGENLPKGKYSLYTIPGEKEWTVIFNKTWDQWGTQYNQENDALRVAVKPMATDFTETMTIGVENVTPSTADVVIAWDKVRVPFTVDIGDVNARILDSARRQIVGSPITAANFVLGQGMEANYEEMLGYLNFSLESYETYGALFVKSRLLHAMGRTDDAIATAEKAIEVGKKNNANTGFLEGLLASWKSGN